MQGDVKCKRCSKKNCTQHANIPSPVNQQYEKEDPLNAMVRRQQQEQNQLKEQQLQQHATNYENPFFPPGDFRPMMKQIKQWMKEQKIANNRVEELRKKATALVNGLYTDAVDSKYWERDQTEVTRLNGEIVVFKMKAKAAYMKIDELQK